MNISVIPNKNNFKRCNNENENHKITVNKTTDHYNYRRQFGKDITNYQTHSNQNICRISNDNIVLKHKLNKLKPEGTISKTNSKIFQLSDSDDICFKPKNKANIINSNPQICDEYIDDIFEHMIETEKKFIPHPEYMRTQHDINDNMRAILIDWLVDVHLKFKLVTETLFLTVNLIDRYLERNQIMRNKLQLVGVASMLIACKYEEILSPEIKDFVYITDRAYNKEEIIEMENNILISLEYNITIFSMYRILELYNYNLKLDELSFNFCRYLIELTLIEYKMIKYKPSVIVSCAIYITQKILKKGENFKLYEITGYSEDFLKECSKDLCYLLECLENNCLQAVKTKFSHPIYSEVSKIHLFN